MYLTATDIVAKFNLFVNKEFKMKLRELKKGDYFTLRKIEYPKENQVYIKGDYDRSDKKYCCTKFSDICSCRSLKPNTEIYVDFIF